MPDRHRTKWLMRLFYSLSECLAANSEPLHDADEGCPIQSEPGSSSIAPADNPIGFTKRLRDMCALSGLESSGASRTGILRHQPSRLQLQDGSRCHDYSTLDDILQFSDVAWPIVAFQSLHHFIGNPIDRLALPLRKLLNEVFDQNRDIVLPLPQRRKVNRENIKAIVKIGPELPFLYHAPQVLVGRRDEPHVDLKRAGAAQALDLFFLKRAQKFWLQFEWKIPNFIKKQCPTVRRLKASHGLSHGAGEGAAFMAEQFALQQSARESPHSLGPRNDSGGED